MKVELGPNGEVIRSGCKTVAEINEVVCCCIFYPIHPHVLSILFSKALWLDRVFYVRIITSSQLLMQQNVRVTSFRAK